MSMQLGRRKSDKQHVWASNHQLTLFICCVVPARLFHHWRTVGLSEYIKQPEKQSERKAEGERQRVFLERLQHQLSVSLLSFSHFSLCNIASPLCPVFIAPTCSPPQHTPSQPPFLSLSQLLLSEAELGVGSKRQETDKIKAVSGFFNSHLLYCQDRRQQVKTENFLLDVSLHSCCRWLAERKCRKTERQMDAEADRLVSNYADRYKKMQTKDDPANLWLPLAKCRQGCAS